MRMRRRQESGKREMADKSDFKCVPVMPVETDARQEMQLQTLG
jgi:hypothetical protein